MRPLARILCVAICAVVLVCHAVAADAQSQVSILIGTTPGGGYDIYARALARHIGRHLPGRPTVIAKNVPGAGGLTLANYMYNRAPADGSELATVQNGLPFEKLFQTLSPDGRNALFDATKFGWVGSITQTVFVTVTWHSAPVKTLAGCHRAAGDPRRQRDQLRQLRAGDAHQPAARYQVQGRARLSRRRRGRSRGGERRGARARPARIGPR